MKTKEKDLITERLKDLYTIALAANLGFLPSVMLGLILAGRVPLLALLIWLLTTFVILFEWWLAREFYEVYSAEFGSLLATVLSVVANFFYVAVLLALPGLLVYGGMLNEMVPGNALAYYAVGFLLLAFLDGVLSVMYAIADQDDRWVFVSYLVYDVFATALYGVFIVAIVPSQLDLVQQTVVLGGFYLSEVILYYLTLYVGARIAGARHSSGSVAANA